MPWHSHVVTSFWVLKNESGSNATWVEDCRNVISLLNNNKKILINLQWKDRIKKSRIQREFKNTVYGTVLIF